MNDGPGGALFRGDQRLVSERVVDSSRTVGQRFPERIVVSVTRIPWSEVPPKVKATLASYGGPIEDRTGYLVDLDDGRRSVWATAFHPTVRTCALGGEMARPRPVTT